IAAVRWDFLSRPVSRGNRDLRSLMATFTHTNPGSSAAMQERWARLRSHKRIISKVKLLVEWDEESAQQCANAVTVDVSHSGCMAVVGAPLPLHRRGGGVDPARGGQAGGGEGGSVVVGSEVLNFSVRIVGGREGRAGQRALLLFVP